MKTTLTFKTMAHSCDLMYRCKATRFALTKTRRSLLPRVPRASVGGFSIFPMSPLIKFSVSLCLSLSLTKTSMAWSKFVSKLGYLTLKICICVWSHLLWSNREELVLCCKCPSNIPVWRHYWETDFWLSQRTPFSCWMTRALSKKP